MRRLPYDIPAEIRALFEDIYVRLDRLSGPNNVDLHGRRMMNAGSAKDPNDYVTLADLQNLVPKLVGKQRGAIIGGAGAGSGGAGTGGGLAGCAGRAAPTVDFPNNLSVVEDYAAANPSQLANSCLAQGGTWDFMDGVVAALQAVDPRYGFNAKRGDCGDPSEDAISYYYGPLSEMNACSINCYVIDIIGGHCGDSPSPAWINQTAAACGGWLPERP